VAMRQRREHTSRTPIVTRKNVIKIFNNL